MVAAIICSSTARREKFSSYLEGLSEESKEQRRRERQLRKKS